MSKSVCLFVWSVGVKKGFFLTFSFFYVFAAVSKGNFVYHFCIGKGGFGKVWRVERKKAK